MNHTVSLHRLGAVVASVGAAQVVLLTLVPIISEAAHLSIASIGGLVALGTFCFMIAGPVWGEISDRKGRKAVVLIGLCGAALAQLLFVSLLIMLAHATITIDHGVLLLAVSRIVYGLSAAGVYPACQAWAVENHPEEQRLSVLSSLSAAANLGRVLGPLLALPALGLASWYGGEFWPLIWLVLLPVLAVTLTLSMSGGQVSLAQHPEPFEMNPGIAGLLAVAMLGTAAIGQLQVMLGPVLGDYYGLQAVAASSWAAGLLLLVAAVSVLVQLLVVRRMEAPRLSLVVGGLFMLAGSGLLWPTMGSLMAVLSLVLFVAGVACVVPGYTTLLSQQAGGQRQGRLFGLLTLMHTAGYTLGFAAGGWIYTHVQDMPLVGLLAAVLLMLVATVVSLQRRAVRRRLPV